jgi:hypothetical protein
MSTNRYDEKSKPTVSKSQQPQEKNGDDEFVTALAQLESCLESPVVPGELLSWLDAIQTSCESLRGPLRQVIDGSHPGDFKEIGREEPDLLRQVELMKQEDEELIKQYRAFREKLPTFRERAEKVEPHESKLNGRVSALAEEGLTLVINIRKQQEAISTWLSESVQRDTGFGD